MDVHKFLITVTRIIAYFSLFYAVLKVVAIFKGLWFWPNFLLGLLGTVVAFLLFRVIKTQRYHWAYVILSAVLFSAIRFYEERLMVYLNNLI